MLKVWMRVIVVQGMSQGTVNQSRLRAGGFKAACNRCGFGFAPQILYIVDHDSASGLLRTRQRNTETIEDAPFGTGQCFVRNLVIAGLCNKVSDFPCAHAFFPSLTWISLRFENLVELLSDTIQSTHHIRRNPKQVELGWVERRR